MAFSFEKTRHTEKKTPEPLSDENQAYHDRAKADQDRYRLAVDTEFWICVCFADERNMRSFGDSIEASGGFAFGDVARAALGKPTGKPKKVFSAPAPHGGRVANPLKGMRYTGDLEADSLSESDAILDAFAVAEGRPVSDVFDSPHHITIIFRDREDCAAFISEYGLSKFGDKYMDGDRMITAL